MGKSKIQVISLEADRKKTVYSNAIISPINLLECETKGGQGYAWSLYDNPIFFWGKKPRSERTWEDIETVLQDPDKDMTYKMLAREKPTIITEAPWPWAITATPIKHTDTLRGDIESLRELAGGIVEGEEANKNVSQVTSLVFMGVMGAGTLIALLASIPFLTRIIGQ